MALLCIKHNWLRKKKQVTSPVLCDLVQTASAVYNFIILGMARIKTRPFSRTNYGLAKISVVASQNWETIPVKIDQFRCIKIQPKTIDFSTRLLGINPTNSIVIPMSLVLRSIVLGWILKYLNWSILFPLQLWKRKQI